MFLYDLHVGDVFRFKKKYPTKDFFHLGLFVTYKVIFKSCFLITIRKEKNNKMIFHFLCGSKDFSYIVEKIDFFDENKKN